jgi:hypothetical protein
MTCRRVKTPPSLTVWSAASQERKNGTQAELNQSDEPVL